MTTRIALLIILSAVIGSPAHAQMTWPNGKVAAIVLTYDDALHSQLDVAIPQLDAAKPLSLCSSPGSLCLFPQRPLC